MSATGTFTVTASDNPALPVGETVTMTIDDSVVATVTTTVELSGPPAVETPAVKDEAPLS